MIAPFSPSDKGGAVDSWGYHDTGAASVSCHFDFRTSEPCRQLAQHGHSGSVAKDPLRFQSRPAMPAPRLPHTGTHHLFAGPVNRPPDPSSAPSIRCSTSLSVAPCAARIWKPN